MAPERFYTPLVGRSSTLLRYATDLQPRGFVWSLTLVVVLLVIVRFLVFLAQHFLHGIHVEKKSQRHPIDHERWQQQWHHTTVVAGPVPQNDANKWWEHCSEQ